MVDTSPQNRCNTGTSRRFGAMADPGSCGLRPGCYRRKTTLSAGLASIG